MIMRARNIIILVLVLLVLGVVLLVTTTPIFASSYTKAALNKNFSQKAMPYITPSSSVRPLDLEAGAASLADNIMVYVYYSYIDYQNHKISKKQFLQVMTNTKPCFDYLTQLFNTNYAIVTKYPIEVKDPTYGASYIELESDGTWNANVVNYVKIQSMMFNSINKMYSTQDPTQIYEAVKEFGVYMERSTFFYSQNTQYGLENTINVQNFDPKWILNNVMISVNSFQSKVR